MQYTRQQERMTVPAVNPTYQHERQPFISFRSSSPGVNDSYDSVDILDTRSECHPNGADID
jgi:hypothetical protein